VEENSAEQKNAKLATKFSILISAYLEL